MGPLPPDPWDPTLAARGVPSTPLLPSLLEARAVEGAALGAEVGTAPAAARTSPLFPLTSGGPVPGTSTGGEPWRLVVTAVMPIATAVAVAAKTCSVTSTWPSSSELITMTSPTVAGSAIALGPDDAERSNDAEEFDIA